MIAFQAGKKGGAVCSEDVGDYCSVDGFPLKLSISGLLLKRDIILLLYQFFV